MISIKIYTDSCESHDFDNPKDALEFLKKYRNEKYAILIYRGRQRIKLLETTDVKDGDVIRVFLKVPR